MDALKVSRALNPVKEERSDQTRAAIEVDMQTYLDFEEAFILVEKSMRIKDENQKEMHIPTLLAEKLKFSTCLKAKTYFTILQRKTYFTKPSKPCHVPHNIFEFIDIYNFANKR